MRLRAVPLEVHPAQALPYAQLAPLVLLQKALSLREPLNHLEGTQGEDHVAVFVGLVLRHKCGNKGKYGRQGSLMMDNKDINEAYGLAYWTIPWGG